MSRVAGIGSTLFDLILYSDSFPVEDTKETATATVVQGGGPCSTALVAVRKLGIDASYIGVVSDDMFGNFIREDFRKWGVDISALKVKKGYETAHSAVFCAKDSGSRTCVFSLGNVPDPVAADYNLEEILKDTEILHLDGYYHDIALKAADIVHRNGGLVSIDAGTMKPEIDDLLKASDIIISSKAFSEKITGLEPERAVLEIEKRYSPLASVITAGKLGGVIALNGEAEWYREFPAEVIDSNGAGDVFHGAFIVAMLHGFDPFECCQFSSAVSAIKCTKKGAREGVPSYAEAIKFLHECGNHFEEEVFKWKK